MKKKIIIWLKKTVITDNTVQ